MWSFERFLVKYLKIFGLIVEAGPHLASWIEYQPSWRSVILLQTVIASANRIRTIALDQLPIDHRRSFFLKLLWTPSSPGGNAELMYCVAYILLLARCILHIPFPPTSLLCSRSFVVHLSHAHVLTHGQKNFCLGMCH